jgi:hypothetical protein
MSLNAPAEKVYKLATELHRDTAAQEAFKQSPADFLGSHGLEIDGSSPLYFTEKGDPEGDLDPEVAAIAVCFVATNVGIGAVVICGVALYTDEDQPIDGTEKIAE